MKIIGWVLIAIVTAVIASTSLVLYNHTVELLTHNLRERIEGVAKTAAPTFSAADIEALQIESDWRKPEWVRVVNQLLAIEENHNDILFAYIFRKDPNDPTKMVFVADSHSIFPYANSDNNPNNDVDANNDGVIEPNGPDYLQWPGQPYEDPPGDTFQVFNVGPLSSSELYEDSFGKVLTGYAPIKNEKGETVAGLAFDVKADDFFTITRQTLFPFLLFILVLSFIILGLFYAVITVWSNQLRKETMQREQLEKLTQQLSHTNHRLQEVDQAKTEFLSLASHQLRSPLTAIKGYSSMILEGSFGEFPKDLKEPLTRIFQSSNHLAQVVADLLDVTKIEQGGMMYNFQSFSLVESIQSVLSEFKLLAKKKKIDLQFKKPAGRKFIIKGDSVKIRQVLVNLIDNAIKYTDEGFVQVTMGVSGKDFVEIKVQDTGIGFDERTKKRIFKKFSRGTMVSKSDSGTGLGMYLAQKIILAHAGVLSADSKGIGKGATFRVKLPLRY